MRDPARGSFPSGHVRVVVWIGRFGIFRRRVFLESIEHDCDGFFELRGVAPAHELRVEFHLNVGRDAVILDLPLPLKAIKRPAWRSDSAAVHQWRVEADPDQPAPSALADERADRGLAEIP